MKNGKELQESWADCGGTKKTLWVNLGLGGGEIFQADEYRLTKTSVSFWLKGDLQARTPIANVWHFVARDEDDC